MRSARRLPASSANWRRRACARALTAKALGQKKDGLNEGADHCNERGRSSAGLSGARALPPQNQLVASAPRRPSRAVLALATGKTQQEITAACKGARPNHIGVVIFPAQAAGRIEQRDGKLYRHAVDGDGQGGAL